MKNHFFLIHYIIKFALYLVKATLYRLYLFTVFLLRLGGAVVMGAVVAGGFYLLRTIEAGTPAAIGDWLAGARDAILMHEPIFSLYDSSAAYGYEIVCVFLGVTMFLMLRVAARIFGPVFYSFPMPRRPFAPQRRWEPPKHAIPAVPCAIVTPPHNQPPWSGDWSEITSRLKPEFQALLSGGQDAPEEPLQRPQVAMVPMGAPEPPKMVSQPSAVPPPMPPKLR